MVLVLTAKTGGERLPVCGNLSPVSESDRCLHGGCPALQAQCLRHSEHLGVRAVVSPVLLGWMHRHSQRYVRPSLLVAGTLGVSLPSTPLGTSFMLAGAALKVRCAWLPLPSRTSASRILLAELRKPRRQPQQEECHNDQVDRLVGEPIIADVCNETDNSEKQCQDCAETNVHNYYSLPVR